MRTTGIGIAICLLAMIAQDSSAQRFSLRTDQAGLAGATDKNGVAVADYDLDGDLDVYLVSYRQYDPNDPATWNHLYRNEGDRTFTDVTDAAGVQSLTGGFEPSIMGNKFGASWGDYDNDGDPDLYLTQIGPELLFRNKGDGTFEQVAEMAGVAGEDDSAIDSGSHWWDYDSDGDLDLYVAAWGDLDHPGGDASAPNRLYQNQGDGTFKNVTEQSGLGDEGRTWASMPIDANNDGLLDLYVVNDFGRNNFLLNMGDGSFEERTEEFGLEDDGHGMGVAVGDVNNDGLFDIYVTNIAGAHKNPLFVNDGTGHFEEAASKWGVEDAGWAWGTEFFDCDHDGDLDLYAVNGFGIEPGANYLFVSQLMPGGDPEFLDESSDSGANGENEARGLVVFDYDDDGDMDMIVANFRDKPYLYENQGIAPDWLKISLEGTVSNRTAFGSVVSVRVRDNVYHRHYDGIDFLGQSVQPLHFGLGFAPSVDEVRVRWPNGMTESYFDIPRNQTLHVVEGQGTSVAVETELPNPSTFGLLGAFPNPFDQSAHVEFSIPAPGTVSLRVYDVLGRQVYGTRDSYSSSGIHRLEFNADHDLPTAGMFVYSIEYGGEIASGKMIRTPRPQ